MVLFLNVCFCLLVDYFVHAAWDHQLVDAFVMP